MWQNKPTYAPVEVICEKPGEYKVVLPLVGIDFKQFKKHKIKGGFQRLFGWVSR